MWQPAMTKSHEAEELSDNAPTCIFVAAAAAVLQGGQDTATRDILRLASLL